MIIIDLLIVTEESIFTVPNKNPMENAKIILLALVDWVKMTVFPSHPSHTVNAIGKCEWF